MPQSLKFKSRMDAVQMPIVPVVGDIIRQVPGTISLGQGVVHYGPPREAIEAARAALDDPVRAGRRRGEHGDQRDDEEAARHHGGDLQPATITQRQA